MLLSLSIETTDEVSTPTPSPVVVGTGVVVGVVCSVCFFIAGALVGVLATVILHKCKKAVQSTSATAPPPPVYEEVESHQGRGQSQVKVQSKGKEFQLEENVAYGHVQ